MIEAEFAKRMLDKRLKDRDVPNAGAITYQDLLEKLETLTPEQRKQPVQIFGPEDVNVPEVVRLKPIYAVGTVEELLHVDGQIDKETRGPDFTHHPEQVIICVDYPPFGKYGDTSYLWQDGNLIGNVSGRVKKFGEPD